MIAELEDKIRESRALLYKWEKRFFAKHDRKPTSDDIRKRPEISTHYRHYNDLKKQLKTLKEEAISPRILFPESKNSQSIQLDRQYTEEEAFWLNVDPSDIIQSQKSEGSSKSAESQPKKKQLILAVADVDARKRKKANGVKKTSGKKQVPQTTVDTALDTESSRQILADIPEGDKDSDEEDGKRYVIRPFKKPRYQARENDLIKEIPSKHEIIKAEFMNGTFGIYTEKDEVLEKEMMQKIEEYAEKNKITIPKPVTIESSAEPIDEKYLEEVEYKKKPIQKRRTRMKDLVFVE